jgi:hypothetical protein
MKGESMENVTEVKRIPVKIDPDGMTDYAFRMLDTAVSRIVSDGIHHKLRDSGDLLIGINIALGCVTDGEGTDQERLNTLVTKIQEMMVAVTDKRDALQREQDEAEEDDEPA